MDLAGRGLQLTNPEYEEEVRGKLRERAEREVASDRLLDTYANQADIAVTDDDLADQIGKILAGAGENAEKMREHYAHDHARDAVRLQMKRARTLEGLVEGADVTDVEPVKPD